MAIENVKKKHFKSPKIIEIFLDYIYEKKLNGLSRKLAFVQRVLINLFYLRVTLYRKKSRATL